MKLSIATSTGVFLAMSTKDALAFAPSNLPAPVASSTSTVSGPTSLALFANNNADDVEESKNNFDFLPKINGNAAASFLMASVLAVSTVATVDTAVFVQPAHAERIVVDQAKPDAKKQKQAPKKVAPKLSAEEKEFNKSKANLDLSKRTLKAYEKLTSDAKSANSKASSALESATKNADSAKKAYGAISDKLSSAKSQKMPQSAVKELSADAAKLKEVLKGKEKIFNDASKTASTTAKALTNSEGGMKESQKAIKKAEKTNKKASTNFEKYEKKVRKQVKEQEKKVKALEKQASKLKSLKEKETKELSSKRKALQGELKSLEELKLL